MKNWKSSVPLALSLLSASALADHHVKVIPLEGGPGRYPEGVAYDSRTKTFYVTGSADGSIQAVGPDDKAKIFQEAGTDGRTGALGIKVDEKRGRLHLTNGARVYYVYDIKKNTLLKKHDIADVLAKGKEVGPAALNDIAINASGDAYVTDSFSPRLFKVDGKTLELTLFKDFSGQLEYGKQNDFPYNFNGIVFSPDQKSLFVVKTNDGLLWQITLKDGKLTRLQTSEPLTKGDGMAWCGMGQKLYIVRNFEQKLSVIDFSKPKDKDNSLTVETRNLEQVNVPTTAACVRGARPALVFVNSQFGAKEPKLPWTLTRLELE